REETVSRWRASEVCRQFATGADSADGERDMIWVAHIAFGACIATIMLYWARTDDSRSAGYALLVLGAISTALVLEMEDGMLIPLNHVASLRAMRLARTIRCDTWWRRRERSRLRRSPLSTVTEDFKRLISKGKSPPWLCFLITH